MVQPAREARPTRTLDVLAVYRVIALHTVPIHLPPLSFRGPIPRRWLRKTVEVLLLVIKWTTFSRPVNNVNFILILNNKRVYDDTECV